MICQPSSCIRRSPAKKIPSPLNKVRFCEEHLSLILINKHLDLKQNIDRKYKHERMLTGKKEAQRGKKQIDILKKEY